MPGYPSRGTVLQWARAHPEFKALLQDAMAARCDDIVMEGMEIADAADRDWRSDTNEDGVAVLTVDKEHLARTKQRLDYRLQLARQLAPKSPQGPLVQNQAAAPGVGVGALLLDQRVLEGHQLRPSYEAYERAVAERR